MQETASQCQGHWIEGVEGSLLLMTWMAAGSHGIGDGRAGSRDIRRGKGHSEQSSITEEENAPCTGSADQLYEEGGNAMPVWRS